MVDIIGRAEELAALRATVDRAPGAPAGLVLHGDPGAGTSVLLQAGVARARRHGMRVLHVAGRASETRLDFGGLHQLLTPERGRLPRIEPFQQDVLRRALGLQAGPAPGGLAVPVAALALLTAVSEDGPVLLAAADTHWLDGPSREVLTFLLPRIQQGELRALCTRRTPPGDEPVPPGIALREVGPLSRPASAALLRRLHPRLPERTRQRVLRDAAGNPRALAEIAAASCAPGAAASGAPAGEDDAPALPPPCTGLERGHAERVRALPAARRGALLLAALDEDGAPQDPADAAAGAVTAELSADDVRALEGQGLVTPGSTPSRLRFRHPLVRSAVVRSASPAELRAAHRALAERHRNAPERRIRHLVAAAAAPDEETAAEIARTARTLTLRGGTGPAATALRRAAALTPDPATAAHRLRCGAELAAEAARLGLAQDLLDEADERLGADEKPGAAADGTGEPRGGEDAGCGPAGRCLPGHGSAVRARIVLLGDGDPAGVRRLLSGTAAPDRPGAEVSARTLRTRVAAAADAQDPAEWERLRRSAADVGGADGAHVRLLHDVHSDVARTAHGATSRLRAAFARLPHDAPPGLVAELCDAAAVLDVLHEYRPYVHDLIRRESGRGAVALAAAGHRLAAHDHTLSGDWSAAEAAADAGLELARRHGLEPLARTLHAELGRIAAGRGDVAAARAHSAAVERWAAPRGSARHLTLAARNLALAALSEGDHGTAYAQSIRITPPGTLARHVGCAPWTVFDLVDAAVHTGRTAEARAHVAAAEHAGLDRLTPRLRLHVLAARALTAPAEEAVPLFRAALAVPRAEFWPFDHARVRLALGELHRRRQRPGEARAELRRAADVFARTGATAWRARAEQELRAAGVPVAGPAAGVPVAGPEHATDAAPAVRPGAGRTPAEATGGVHDLTAQQREVARLAASGLSNKEIAERLHLSPRTVGAHLYRIFPKLGITSRSALRDALGHQDHQDHPEAMSDLQSFD